MADYTVKQLEAMGDPPWPGTPQEGTVDSDLLKLYAELEKAAQQLASEPRLWAWTMRNALAALAAYRATHPVVERVCATCHNWQRYQPPGVKPWGECVSDDESTPSMSREMFGCMVWERKP